MIIGIIGAMDEEIALLLKDLEDASSFSRASMEFRRGKLYGKEVVLVRSGIGKVNAAICTQILVDLFNVDIIINVGVAGGVGEKVEPGDVVIASSLLQHDVDATAFGYEIGKIPRMEVLDFKCDEGLIKLSLEASRTASSHKCYVGKIATGDQFIASTQKISWIHSTFDAIACEMEGGSIAQACYLNHKPFVVIRSISDNAQSGAHMDYDRFVNIAVNNSVGILKNILTLM